MEIKVNRSDIIWSYLAVIFSFASSIIVFPLVVYFLDNDMLGLWYVFCSIGAMTIIFDFGFTPTFARNITYCWGGAKELKKTGVSNEVAAEPDYELLRDILYTCRKVYLLISGLALLLMLTAGSFYIFRISNGISGTTHIIAWFIYVAATFIKLYYNYFDSFLRGVGCVTSSCKIRVGTGVIYLLLSAILLFLGYGILSLCIAFLISNVFSRILGNYYFYNYKNIRKHINEVTTPIDKKKIYNLFRTIWYNTWRDGIVALSVYLSSQASVIICSLYLTLSETGIYSIAMQITNVVAMLSSTLYNTYQPSLQMNWIKRNMDEMNKIMSRIIFVLITTYILGAVGTIALGIPVLKWLKPSVVIEIPILLSLFIYQFMLRFRDCFSSYFSCTNRLIYVPAFVVSSILSVVLSIILLQWFNMGMWGLVIAQIVSQGVFNFWYWAYLANKELHLSFNSLIQSVTRK